MALDCSGQRYEDRMSRAPCVHRLEFGAPPGQQTKALGRIADLVAQIVRPAAVRIDVVEILVQFLGKEEADYVEILIMMRRQPARIGLRLRDVVGGGQRLGRTNEVRGRQEHGYGMIAVFRWPLWLIRCFITSSRFASGSSLLMNCLAVICPPDTISSAFW